MYISHVGFYCVPGHIGIAVPDVSAACKLFEEQGVTFVKKPDDGGFLSCSLSAVLCSRLVSYILCRDELLSHI